MLPTTLPWAWRLFQSADTGNDRFLIAFLHAHSQGAATQDWSCDEIARTEEEARAYALRFGISPDSFSNALAHLRAGGTARKHAD
jgi:hypothetical protein